MFTIFLLSAWFPILTKLPLTPAEVRNCSQWFFASDRVLVTSKNRTQTALHLCQSGAHTTSVGNKKAIILVSCISPITTKLVTIVNNPEVFRKLNRSLDADMRRFLLVHRSLFLHLRNSRKYFCLLAVKLVTNLINHHSPFFPQC